MRMLSSMNPHYEMNVVSLLVVNEELTVCQEAGNQAGCHVTKSQQPYWSTGPSELLLTVNYFKKNVIGFKKIQLASDHAR